MSIIKLHDKYFKTYISAEKIDEATQQLVDQVSADLNEEEKPLFYRYFKWLIYVCC